MFGEPELKIRMTAASLEAMRARAREWLRESHNLRAAGFNVGAEEKRTDRLARDVLALLDMVEDGVDPVTWSAR